MNKSTFGPANPTPGTQKGIGSFIKKAPHPQMGRFFTRLFVQFLVGVIVIFAAEPFGQPLLHAAAAHGQIVPAADQQADERRERQAGADDLHDLKHNLFTTEIVSF